MNPKRVLFLLPSPAAPREPAMSRFHYLARYFEGDVVQPGWRQDDDDRLQALGPPEAGATPCIRFHYSDSAGYPAPVRAAWDWAYYLLTAGRLLRRGPPYDCVIAFGFFKTALAGWLVARATGARLIIEVAVRQERIVALRRRCPGLLARLEHRLSVPLAGWLLRRADHLRLMYPGQVDSFPQGRGVPASAFPDFVAVSRMQPGPDSGVVLCMGSPLYLKGADIAIAAFAMIAGDFPGHRLLVVGHAPDLAGFKALAADHPRIEFAEPLPHARALQLIAGASCLLVPSRSDAMPRVVVEAMAMRTPVVASRVDGLAHYLRHGETALLCEAGNAQELARNLRAVLAQPELARRLCDGAQHWALGSLSEAQYAERFRDMVAACMAARPVSH
jgi:glycosyltransferase involved in cell wall biosynthesis